MKYKIFIFLVFISIIQELKSQPYIFSLTVTPSTFVKRAQYSFELSKSDTVAFIIRPNLGPPGSTGVINYTIFAAGYHTDSLRMDNWPDGEYYLEMAAPYWTYTQRKFVKSATAQLNENSYETNIYKIFPNPAKDQLNIESSREVQIQFLNHLGQVVKEIVVAEGKHSITIEELPAALYTLKVSDGERVKVMKLVKE